MISRVLEEAGLITVSLSLVREHTVQIKPPRALWVPFPFGHALGRPNDPALQHDVLSQAFALLDAPAGPVLHDFAGQEDIGEPSAAPQASQVVRTANGTDVAMEVTRTRQLYERWVARNGRTLVGLTGIPPTRFRGIVRFLEQVAAGTEADMPERPADVPLPVWIRRCADDLKALYTEARLASHPNARGEEIHRWLWGETALGGLLRSVRDRLDAADDPRWKAAAFGIAR